MTTEKKSDESDPKPKSPAATTDKQGEAAPAATKPGYVFKIVPADPKNAFDFEDVADK
jgi:hypothetical protein